MDYLLDKYKRTFGETLTALGYKRYNKTFYLVENDIVKKITLNRTKTNCHLEYGVMPFCFPIDSKACLSGGRYLLLPPPDRIWYAWFFIENVPEKVDPVVEDMLRATNECIVPWFDKMHDCRDAYPEMIELEKRLFKGNIEMNDYVKVCICIKNEDYEKAQDHMAAILKQNLGAAGNIEALEAAGQVEYAEIMRRAIGMYEKTLQIIADMKEKKRNITEYKQFLKQFKPELQECIEELYRLSIPDVEYFQDVVAKNEAVSLEYLKHPNRRNRGDGSPNCSSTR